MEQKSSLWQKNKIILKGALIGLLALVLLIPTLLIMNLVQERMNRADEAKYDISAQWGGRQELSGPVICIPHWKFVKVDKKVSRIKAYAYFLPSDLNIVGSLEPEIKHLSIFEMTVYTANLKMTGNFDGLDLSKIGIPYSDFIFSEAQVLFGLSDFKGIKEEMSLKWDDQNLKLNAGMPDNYLIGKGLSSKLILNEAATKEKHSFSMNIKLRGAEGISFLPFGKQTKVKLNSKWGDPAFKGNSPEYTLTDSSFSADWTMLHVNREYPQEWKDGMDFNTKISSFGVDLINPVNHYSKTERSVKYAILIILLTFVVYFFIEIFQKRSAHAIQYLLIGAALVIFYTLLLSISEVIGFNWAYLVAAAATVILVGTYTSSVFNSKKSGLIFSAFLSGLYLFIFSLIQLQDQALLFGSIGLFIILALIMYTSRKVDWNNK